MTKPVIAIAGSSGLIGSALAAALRAADSGEFDSDALVDVFASRPEVLAHNIERVD